MWYDSVLGLFRGYLACLDAIIDKRCGICLCIEVSNNKNQPWPADLPDLFKKIIYVTKKLSKKLEFHPESHWYLY